MLRADEVGHADGQVVLLQPLNQRAVPRQGERFHHRGLGAGPRDKGVVFITHADVRRVAVNVALNEMAEGLKNLLAVQRFIDFPAEAAQFLVPGVHPARKKAVEQFADDVVDQHGQQRYQHRNHNGLLRQVLGEVQPVQPVNCRIDHRQGDGCEQRGGQIQRPAAQHHAERNQMLAVQRIENEQRVDAACQRIHREGAQPRDR